MVNMACLVKLKNQAIHIGQIVMIKIVPYKHLYLDDTIEIFTQLSAYYLKDNASDRGAVANNLKKNIVSHDSAMKLLLAYHQQTVCGLAAYTIMYPATKETGQLFLKELFISPDFSRKRIGETLMSYIANIALQKNCSRFDWTSNEDSIAAKNFYEKLGAPIIEKKKYYRFSGKKLKEIAGQLPEQMREEIVTAHPSSKYCP
ncbi:MAG: ribosomal protein S18 acetylase RimI-like enzyme [Cellvibrionaceae bacterium]|jgi:ribosomal protein S18 acetylase RimI-like enzyme